MSDYCKCGTEIFPYDSNVEGVCLECQDYNYRMRLSMANQPKLDMEVKTNMRLFEAHFDQRDGENEYTTKHWVCAPNINQASNFFSNELAEWFGDGTEVEERYTDGTIRSVVPSCGYPIVKLDWVAEQVATAVEGTDGNMYHITYEIEEED